MRTSEDWRRLGAVAVVAAAIGIAVNLAFDTQWGTAPTFALTVFAPKALEMFRGHRP